MAIARGREGSYLPFSMELMLCLDTPRAAPSWAAGLAQAAHVVIQGDHPPSGHTPHERMSCLLDMSSVLDNIRHVKPASHNSFIGCCVQEEKSDA